NSKQPHLTGTTVAGATVQLATVSGTLLGTALAAADGSYSILVSSSLADGSYSLRVQATDAAGNPSAFSNTLSLTIDTTAPAMPAAPALAAADDSGTKGDGITNITLPHLTGTVEPSATVQLVNGAGTVISTTTAQSTGAYSVTPATALSDGAYSLSV